MYSTHSGPRFEPIRKSATTNLQRRTRRGEDKLEEITSVADEWEQLQTCINVLSKMLDEQIAVNRQLTQALQSLPVQLAMPNPSQPLREPQGS